VDGEKKRKREKNWQLKTMKTREDAEKKESLRKEPLRNKGDAAVAVL